MFPNKTSEIYTHNLLKFNNSYKTNYDGQKKEKRINFFCAADCRS